MRDLHQQFSEMTAATEYPESAPRTEIMTCAKIKDRLAAAVSPKSDLS
jgi:hypothetical protein